MKRIGPIVAGLYLFALMALWVRVAPETRASRPRPVQVATGAACGVSPASPAPPVAWAPVRAWLATPTIEEGAVSVRGAIPRVAVAPGVFRVPLAGPGPWTLEADGSARELEAIGCVDLPPRPTPAAPPSLWTPETLPAELEARVVACAPSGTTPQLVATGASVRVLTPPAASPDVACPVRAEWALRANRPMVRLELTAGQHRVRRNLAAEGRPVSIASLEITSTGRRAHLERSGAGSTLYCELFDASGLRDAWTLDGSAAVLDLGAPDTTQRLQCLGVLGDPTARGDAFWLAPGGAALDGLPAPLTPLPVSSSLAEDLAAEDATRKSRRSSFLWLIGASLMGVGGIGIARGLRAGARDRAKLEAAVAEATGGDPEAREGPDEGTAPVTSWIRQRVRVELLGMIVVFGLAVAALLALFALM